LKLSMTAAAGAGILRLPLPALLVAARQSGHVGKASRRSANFGRPTTDTKEVALKEEECIIGNSQLIFCSSVLYNFVLHTQVFIPN
jgi:hypothetical protein